MCTRLLVDASDADPPTALPTRSADAPAKRWGHEPHWNEIADTVMKKLKHEAELFKAAMLAGVKYAEGRGVVEFEATDSASEMLLYNYRLLVHDKVIQALPEDQVAEKSLRHKLALWYAKPLPTARWRASQSSSPTTVSAGS
jgi:hypothetical protein